MTELDAGLIDYGPNDVFRWRPCLGILAMLSVVESVDTAFLKQSLELTDDGLGFHLRQLEDVGFISTSTRTDFFSRKPRTHCWLTSKGRTVFRAHVEQLERLLSQP